MTTKTESEAVYAAYRAAAGTCCGAEGSLPQLVQVLPASEAQRRRG